MKKLFAFMAAVFAALTLASCGGDNTPKGVTEQFIKAIQDQDGEKMASLIYFPDGKSPETEGEREQFVAMMNGKVNTTYANYGKLKSYEIQSEEVSEDGTEAVVAVHMEYEKKTSDDKVKLKKDPEGNWKIDMRK